MQILVMVSFAAASSRLTLDSHNPALIGGKSAASAGAAAISVASRIRCDRMVLSFADSAGSDDEQVDELVDWRGLQRGGVQREIEYRALLPGGESAGEVGPEFLDEDRDPLLAATAVTDRVF